MLRAALLLSLLAAGPLAAQAQISVERAGRTTTTRVLDVSGVENFNNVARGTGQTLTTNFGLNGVTGTIRRANIVNNASFGGAGGNYISTSTTTGTSLTLQTSDPNGFNYFGLWVAAVDSRNHIEFLKNGQVVATYSIAALTNNLSGSYDGINLNGNLTWFQKFAFLNFQFRGRNVYDTVRLFQNSNSSSAFEADNYTIGYSHAAAVPEPSTWAMMIVGVGAAGIAMRRQRRALSLAAR